MPEPVHARGHSKLPGSGRLRDWSNISDQSQLFASLFAVIAAGLVARPAATSIGPVLSEMSTGLGISPAVAGVLTALPGFTFAVVGLFAAKLPRRFGLLTSLLVSSTLMVIGMVLRVLGDSWQFFLVFSFMALAGMAVANVLVPIFIKSERASQTALLTASYTTFLAVGQVLPTVFSSPLASAGTREVSSDFGWRFALGVWSLLAVLSLLAWIWVARRRRTKRGNTNRQVKNSRPVAITHLWHSPTAVALMLFFGIQSMHAFLQFGWLPTIYRDGGLSPTPAALMVTIVTLCGVPAGILIPSLVNRGKFLRTLVVSFAVLSALGYVGIALAPAHAPWLWAVALGIAGGAFATSLALITARTRSVGVTAAVSGFVQPVGYFLAALGPLAVGMAFEAIGRWQPILFGLAASSVFLGVSGLVAVRPRMIDDELPRDALDFPVDQPCQGGEHGQTISATTVD